MVFLFFFCFNVFLGSRERIRRVREVTTKKKNIPLAGFNEREMGGTCWLRGRSPVLWRHRWGGLPFISNCYGGYHRNSLLHVKKEKKKAQVGGRDRNKSRERPAPSHLYLLLYNRLFLYLTVWGKIL